MQNMRNSASSYQLPSRWPNIL